MNTRASSATVPNRFVGSIAALCCLLSVCAHAAEFWPGATYDPAVPTLRKVVGHDPGERISTHAQIRQYLDALAAFTPRLKVVEYGESWEGRKLVYAIVGSEANMRALDEIRAGIARLADPRQTPEADARKLIASLPTIVWLTYGVHGNELSTSDAALVTAYHLLASRDKMTADMLAGAVIILVPTQNPDGRDRFIHHFEQAVGLEPDASPAAAEHVEPWPGGRGNHYLFDLNRDWFSLTQPEISSQVKALRAWYPQVFVDLHEMGANSTYFFAPYAMPVNPHLTKQQRETLAWFGRDNARWFDQYGIDYFTRDVYDGFFPGYGESWPSYFGSIGMTYEQASSRGLLMRRSNETTFHFRDTVRHHFIASLSTITTAARRREELLRRFFDYRTSAIEEGGRETVREYILPREKNTSAVDKLAGLLAAQGIEMKRATMPLNMAGREFPAGSYVIPLAQPAKRLIRVLLDPQVPMEDDFVREQERLRKKKLPSEIYDVTAWSLPLCFNVEVIAADQPTEGKFEAVTPPMIPPGRVARKENTIAYIVPWGTQAAGRFLAAALRNDLNVMSSDKPFAQGGRKFPAGTLVLRTAGNPPDLDRMLEELARASGAEVVATDTGWMEEGADFGSRHAVRLRKPGVALVWDRPTMSASAGWARFVLERQFGYPVTAVRAQTFSTADLKYFHVIIVPDSAGDYASVFGSNGAKRLKDWVQNGGTLIAIGRSAAYLANPQVGLLAVAQENAARPEPAKKADTPKPAEGAKAADTGKMAEPAKPDSATGRVPGKLLASEEEYLKAIQAESELPDTVPGVLLKAQLDPDHWLSSGLGESVYALVSGRVVFTPVKLDKGVNAAVFAAPDQLVASGHMWEETKKQFAFKPLVIAQPEGRGQVIAFTADPNFRAHMDGLNMLFINAVLRGPGRTRGPVAESEENHE